MGKLFCHPNYPCFELSNISFYLLQKLNFENFTNCYLYFNFGHFFHQMAFLRSSSTFLRSKQPLPLTIFLSELEQNITTFRPNLILKNNSQFQQFIGFYACQILLQSEKLAKFSWILVTKMKKVAKS